VTEPLHFKSGNGIQVTRYISSLKSYIVTFLLTEKSWHILSFLNGVALVTFIKVQ
jgi:hypothetical protein